MNQNENKVVEEVIVPVEKTELELVQEKLAKAEEDRDNYKQVALKRLGKLPGDADFINKEDVGELSVAEQVKLALLDREVEQANRAKEDLIVKQAKTISELTLALKNRPGSSTGGDSGSSVEVKDNVFSEQQLISLRAKAARLKADPEKFINAAKENLMRRS